MTTLSSEAQAWDQQKAQVNLYDASIEARTHLCVVASGGPAPSIESDHQAWKTSGQPCLLCDAVAVREPEPVPEIEHLPEDACTCLEGKNVHPIWCDASPYAPPRRKRPRLTYRQS
jgi:hypothetical protein